MLWWLIALWFLPPLMFLSVFLVALLTGLGGRHSKVIRNDAVAGCSCALNVTDTSAATRGAAPGQEPSATPTPNFSCSRSCWACRHAVDNGS